MIDFVFLMIAKLAYLPSQGQAHFGSIFSSVHQLWSQNIIKLEKILNLTLFYILIMEIQIKVYLNHLDWVMIYL